MLAQWKGKGYQKGQREGVRSKKRKKHSLGGYQKKAYCKKTVLELQMRGKGLNEVKNTEGKIHKGGGAKKRLCWMTDSKQLQDSARVSQASNGRDSQKQGNGL